MAKALLLRADRTMSVVNLDKLADYQAAVGGYIETVTLHRHYGKPAVLVMNEDGWGMELPHNLLASSVSSLFTSMTETIVGDALIVGDDGEEFGDIPEDMLRFLTSAANTSIIGDVYA